MGKETRSFIGVDLGGTGIKVGVLDAKNRLLGTEKTKTRSEEGSGAIVKRIARTVREAMEEARVKPANVGGLGIGAPGVVDINKGIVIQAVNLRWNKFPLAKLLRDELKMPVTLDNDVNVGTWGEFVLGAARGHNDVLGVFVGTGIGGGLVLHGKLYHGHFLTAGEIGHVTMYPGMVRGRRTLENNASRTAIVNLLSQLILSNHPSKLSEITGGDPASTRSKAIAQAVAKDDPLTIEVLKSAAEHIGIAIANVVTVMSLPCVVLGGGLTEALDKRWTEWVAESFENHVFPPELRHCKIVTSKLGDDAGVVGAALLARERLGH
ncbi:MAG: ROK family protein [Planctomycetes bacterium]|nr:ROK family protein [Planctomycetota bacterium]